MPHEREENPANPTPMKELVRHLQSASQASLARCETTLATGCRPSTQAHAAGTATGSRVSQPLAQANPADRRPLSDDDQPVTGVSAARARAPCHQWPRRPGRGSCRRRTGPGSRDAGGRTLHQCGWSSRGPAAAAPDPEHLPRCSPISRHQT